MVRTGYCLDVFFFVNKKTASECWYGLWGWEMCRRDGGPTAGSLCGFSARRGELQWRFDTGSPIIGSPAIINGIIYIGATDHTLYALPT